MATDATQEPEAVADTRKGRRVKLSPELDALVNIEGMLDDLDGPDRFRVLTWMCLKYGKNCHMDIVKHENANA